MFFSVARKRRGIPRSARNDGIRKIQIKIQINIEDPCPRCAPYKFLNAKGPFQQVEREIPEPGAGAVRIRVQACGICHSDEYAKEGSRPGITYPRVPGHEIAGVIDANGAGVIGWEKGQRVGVGWHGGHCG